MNEIVMPKLSDTMTEGTLVSWKKRVGDAVRRGDVLAEVETDKANMELEAFVSGELLEIRVQAGEMVQVGTVIGVIGKAEEKGAQAGQPPVAPKAEPAETKPQVAAAAEPKPETAEPAAAAPVPPPANGGVEAADAEGQAPPAESRERAAPVVRRRARELGVDLASVKGSGPDGRILLQDLERHETPAESGQPSAAKGPRPLSRLRAAIAKTVSESWRSIPHFDVSMDLLMDEAEAVRRQLKQSGVAVTLTGVLVKGVSLALQKFPLLHASFAADGVQLHGEINVGIAVAVPDGVLVPVIHGCQGLSLAQISTAGRGLAERARAGSLSEQEMSGGTFSVSNLGMYGVSQFSAIIYPSHAAVLAVGAVVDTAVVHAGALACAKVMKVTLSADHRLVDGAYAAQFLVELKGILENPVRLLI